MERKIDAGKISLERAEVLKSRIGDYLLARENIPAGLEQKEEIKARQEKIKRYFKASDDDWDDWHWQMRNRITDPFILADLLSLQEGKRETVAEVGKRFRWAVSPYYLSLIDSENLEKDPVYLQSVPSAEELDLDEDEDFDPMGEEFTHPAPCITRRYPDRLIIYVTNQCGMYCRHCQRRRNIGETDSPVSRDDLEKALEYIRENPEIRDVLITGGDALTYSDDLLDWLLGELDRIPSVEIKRLGTRMPVTLPQRVTPELCAMLKKHHPLYINTHFNTPAEITEDSKKACEMLADAGIPLGNQAVLLAGVNDDRYVMRKLNQDLLRIRVRPYYIFHAKGVAGTKHFRTSVDKGIEIMEYLRGYTSGLAVPTFIVNAPKGKGKTPMLPDYILEKDDDRIVFRTWEREIIEYPNYYYRDRKNKAVK